jgi:hypothetical protein
MRSATTMRKHKRTRESLEGRPGKASLKKLAMYTNYMDSG